MPEVLDALDSIVRAQPDAIAVVARDATASFASLDADSRLLAHRLRDEGVREGDVVALSLGRTAKHVVGMLAAWRAGAAFFAVDAAAPEDRVRSMLEESRARLILSLEGGPLHVQRLASGRPPLAAPADALAYVVYTSGSTGRPKGVRVSHRGLLLVLRAQIRAFGLARGKRSLLHLSTAFDASISDIGTALVSGATLVIPDRPPSPENMAELLRVEAITHADLPPSILALIDPATLPPSLETVVIGGEVCPPSIVRAWARHVRVVNVYGPTEATICTSLGVCDPDRWERPLIGDPFDHVEYAIEGGELLIAGPALALGYIDRPELESERFVLRTRKRWYRTGDRVRRHDDGGVEFLGRFDRQIKLHGQLVCPEEIEALLRAVEGVVDAAVIEEGREAGGGLARTSLTALVVARDPASLTPASLHDRLEESLPRWMLPRIVLAPSLARRLSGKVDHAALALDAGPPISDPRTRAVAEAFAQVFALPDVGANDDLLALGGDSLAALEIAAAAQLSGVAIDASTVMGARTPVAIARAPRLRERTVAELDAIADRLAADLDAGSANAPPGEEWLVTGATGFLGQHLLPAILARTQARVHCVVRAPSDAEARARLGAIGTDLRIVAHAGDVSAPAMGLTAVRFRELARVVGHVVHAAASLSLALPFEALEIANVRGACEVARFARFGASKALHHVSSLAVLASSSVGAETLDERTALAPDTRVFGPYAQTKWIAEALLRRVVPDLRVIRAGLLTGDSSTGAGARACPLGAFLRAVTTLKCLPLGDQQALRVDVTPVDHAARAIADVVTSPRAAPLVHIASEEGASLGDLVRVLRGQIEIAIVSREEFIREARNRLSRDSALALVASSYRLLGADAQRGADLFLHTGRRFPCMVLESITRSSMPPIDDPLLTRYVARAGQGLA